VSPYPKSENFWRISGNSCDDCGKEVECSCANVDGDGVHHAASAVRCSKTADDVHIGKPNCNEDDHVRVTLDHKQLSAALAEAIAIAGHSCFKLLGQGAPGLNDGHENQPSTHRFHCRKFSGHPSFWEVDCIVALEWMDR